MLKLKENNDNDSTMVSDTFHTHEVSLSDTPMDGPNSYSSSSAEDSDTIDIDQPLSEIHRRDDGDEDEEGTKSSLQDLPSSSSEAGNSTDGGADGALLGLEKNEGYAIQGARVLLIVFVLSAAAALGWVVYSVARNDEIGDFEAQFHDLAQELRFISEENIEHHINVFQSLSTTLTANVQQSHDEHGEEHEDEDDEDHHSHDDESSSSSSSSSQKGFITLPRVEEQFAVVRNLIGASTIAYMPLVHEENLAEWRNYSESHQEWISTANGGVPTQPIPSHIWEFDSLVEHDIRVPILPSSSLLEEEDGHHEGPFAPIWTISPPPLPDKTGIVNYNLLDSPMFHEAANLIDFTQKGAIMDTGYQSEWFNSYHDHLHHVDADDLSTAIVIPVYEDFNEEKDNNSREIVGYLMASIPWNAFFQHVLHRVEDKPITIVMENTCGQVFTMEIVGDDASILNPIRDVHDSYYDYLGESFSYVRGINPAYAGDEGSIEHAHDHGDSDDQEDEHEDDHEDDHDDHHRRRKMSEESIDHLDDNEKESLGDHCVYTITLYPTAEFEEAFLTSDPKFYMLIVFCVFASTTLFFFLFDFLVQKRQQRVVTVAKKQNAIVSSFFPKNIQAKLLADSDQTTKRLSTLGKAGIKSYLKESLGVHHNIAGAEGGDKSKPIADLFPETTIMFADISGFTAWSSTREPSMVFTLLETLYHFFDATAKRRRVFKVEVVGDCYVAVCGLPDPRADHAIVMAKFATECLQGMGRLTRELEVELGPDTTELGLRIGLHSGSVVAGVLRGEKSRFQLFGDTMNTASRMESTGVPNQIQISQETADLLVLGNKPHWITPRQDKVHAKGKGELSTFWLELPSNVSLPEGSNRSSSFKSSATKTSEFMTLQGFQARDNDDMTKHRLAEWTIEVLASLLKEIETRRRGVAKKKEPVQVPADMLDMKHLDIFAPGGPGCFEKNSLSRGWEKRLHKTQKKKGTTVIDEVEEIITLPAFNAGETTGTKKKEKGVKLSDEVTSELRLYVRSLASMYNDNSFHNFAHANHVTMSVTKLLGRIVAPDVENLGDEGVNQKSLHDHTYGITSDPLTRFAVVLSALIHDVDHDGVSNIQLVREKTPEAKKYKNKSVAEQNSVDLAWNLLMEPAFENLRDQIYSTEAEFKRFRQLVVNTVMATDIMDKDLKKLRDDRWETAFSIPPEEERNDSLAVNRKATIVIEHLIQASDVAHTMQHWHIYRKWNERLFCEMYKAYQNGRMEEDPSIGWYEGEIGFFDFYIIPLAKKLVECGVFGVSSLEYLSYAEQNRKEWKQRGKGIVEEMKANVQG